MAPPTAPSSQPGKTETLPSGTKSWFTTPNPFEQRFGYHRAVRRGPFIFVSGTTALKDVSPDPSSPSSSSSSSSSSSAKNTSSSTGNGTTSTSTNTTTQHQDQPQQPRTIAGGIPIPPKPQFPAYYAHHVQDLQYGDPPAGYSRDDPPVFIGDDEDVGNEQQQQQQQQQRRQGSESENERDRASKVHDPTSARKQAQIAMERCVAAVEKLGGRRKDVVRVKMFVSRHGDCLDVGEAFKTCFGSSPDSEVGAAATMIVVRDGFVDPDILVEVEIDAVVVEGATTEEAQG